MHTQLKLVLFVLSLRMGGMELALISGLTLKQGWSLSASYLFLDYFLQPYGFTGPRHIYLQQDFVL